MSNIFNWPSIYTNFTNVRDSTTKAGLIALSDAEIDILIDKAQSIVDSYIISYWTPFVETQKRIFPINVNSVSTIPSDITRATFYVVEQLYESWDLITAATSTSSWWNIKSEKTGDRTITYTEWWTVTTNNTLKFLGIPPEAKRILQKYRKNFYITKI